MIKGRVTIRVNKLPELAGAVRRKAADEVENSADQCAERARSLAPVDEGAMRASIGVEVDSDLTRRVVVGQFYASFVEFGTRKMAARPFMTPAAETTKPVFYRKMRALVMEVAK